MVGVAQLFPWNALLTNFSWYQFKFGCFPFMFAMSIAFNWPNIIMLIILTSSLGQRISTLVKLYGSLLINVFLLLALPVLNAWDWSQDGRVYLSLLIVFCAGLATATLVGTGFGIVASLPPTYTTALMTGQGLAGILVGGLKLLFDFQIWPGKLSPEQSEEQGVVYYAISASVMLICLFCTFLLQRSEFYNYYHNNKGSYVTIQEDKDMSDIAGSLSGSVSDETQLYPAEITRLSVFKKIWPDALNAYLIFFISLSLFPGFTTMIDSYSNNANFGAAFFTILVSIFQLGDAIGRMGPAIWAPQALKRFLWVPVVARLAFFPLFILSIRQVGIFQADWIPIIVMVVFSVSNGYFGSCAMMWGPTRVEGPELEIAGTMMSFFLQFGIWSGVHFALLLKFVVTGTVIDIGDGCNVTA